MDVSVEIHCGKCGSANYSLPGGAEAGAPIVCNDCGETFGTIAALQAELIAQVVEHSAESLRRNLEWISQTDLGDAAS